jgi:hypothetical protein
MGAAGNSATAASTDNFDDEGDMGEAGSRGWPLDIALGIGAGSASQGSRVDRQLAQACGRGLADCHRLGASPLASLSLRHE